jgi:hypothetical protein
MDTRMSLGLGTAAVALLLLPLGYQLYTTTAITPPGFESRDLPNFGDDDHHHRNRRVACRGSPRARTT